VVSQVAGEALVQVRQRLTAICRRHKECVSRSQEANFLVDVRKTLTDSQAEMAPIWPHLEDATTTFDARLAEVDQMAADLCARNSQLGINFKLHAGVRSPSNF
jgi:hypothetical protein